MAIGRFVIMGTGVVGASIGARLWQSRHPVLLVARGAHLQALQTRGLRFRRPGQDVNLRIPLAQLLDRCGQVAAAPIADAPRPGGSLWQSAHRGSGSELPWLNGYIVRLGLAHGVPTPLNARLIEA